MSTESSHNTNHTNPQGAPQTEGQVHDPPFVHHHTEFEADPHATAPKEHVHDPPFIHHPTCYEESPHPTKEKSHPPYPALEEEMKSKAAAPPKVLATKDADENAATTVDVPEGEEAVKNDAAADEEMYDSLPWYDSFAFSYRGRIEKSRIHDKLVEKYKRFPFMARLDHYFGVTERESSWWDEFVGGTCTFVSMAYIMILNPIIVGEAIGVQHKEGIFFATALASGGFTVMMGLIANVPVALAPGMGLNGYFANVARVAADGTLIGLLTWEQGMASIMMAGIIYLIFTYSKLRYILFSAVPDDLKHAMSAGIGLFICIIGYKIGWILGINYYGGPISTFTAKIPFFNYDIAQVDLRESPEARVTIIGLVFVAFFLTLRWKAGILIAILLTTLCGIRGDGLGKDSVTSLKIWHEDPIPFLAKTEHLISGQLDFSHMGTTAFWDVTWTFLFVEMFDSFGTLSTVVMRSGIAKGSKKLTNRLVTNAMAIDGWGTFLGAFIGSNSITSYVESLTGIAAGARTGFASVVTGIYFLLSLLFVYPFIAIIPDSATVPALFMVGVFSMESVKDIDFTDFPIAFSSFMIIATMPFTYSIANGIAAGFIFYNFTMIVRFLEFRYREWRSGPIEKDSTFNMWESGWNPKDPKDHLPHWAMVLMGVFMVLRYQYFFN